MTVRSKLCRKYKEAASWVALHVAPVESFLVEKVSIAGAGGPGTRSADTTRRCGDIDRPKFEFQVGLWLCFWPGRSTDSRDSDSELGPRYAKVTRMLVRGRAFFVVAEDSSFQVASCHDRSKLRGQRRKLHPPFVHLTRLLGTTVAQVKIGMCCRDVEG